MIHFRSFVFVLLIVNFTSSKIKNKGWWKNIILYEVFPRSFMDSNGDGTGDLKGIISKLDHFVDLGVEAIWMSPINMSPQVDIGYDISDYRSIDPLFGTLDDYKELIKKANKLGIRIMFDFVPNHTSDQHKWFTKSVNCIGKYKDYYVWRRGRENNTKPPNNWLSVFSGSAWTYNKKRDLWYLHQFEYRQPDLNFHNPAVHQEMLEILKYWLDIGVNGFRFDALDYLYEDERFLDEPLSRLSGVSKNERKYLRQLYTTNDPRNLDLVTSWRKVVDNWTDIQNQEEKILLTECYFDPTRYYDFRSNVPFNNDLVMKLTDMSKPSDFKKEIDKFMEEVPQRGVPNWMTSNHDRKRITTRYAKKPDFMVMLVMVLPGVACVYYGDEISMEDNMHITWKETKDIWALITNQQKYKLISRDPQRTPFQWNYTRNANFSTAEKTWLPINQNYLTLNLEIQKTQKNSPYKLFKTLSKLRNTSESLSKGSLKTNVVNRNTVLVISRQTSTEAIVLLNNFYENPQNVDASKYLPGIDKATAVLSSRGSNITWGSSLSVSNVKIPPFASVLLVGTIKTSN